MLLLLESDVAYPCITVHLMKLRNVLTVGRVGSRRPTPFCDRSDTVVEGSGDSSQEDAEGSSKELAFP